MRSLFLCFALVCASAPADAQNTAASGAPAPAPQTAVRLTAVDAIVLGVVEGVTEFLPVSSTGHLIVAARFLGLDSEQPLADAAGRPLWHKPPSEKYPGGVPLTVKLATDTYLVVIQAGAIAAVAMLYWSQFMAMLRGVLGRDPAGLRLLVNVLIAFVPAAGLGFLAGGWIDRHLFSVGAVIVAQVVGAGLMFYADRWLRQRSPAAAGAALDALTPRTAARIGALQCLALWPGMSRSMTTIIGGYFAGLDPRRAAEFSFLLGFVTLCAASVYKGAKSGAAMLQVFGWSELVLGGAVAAVTAALCVRFLVHWLTRHGLALFAWYRIAFAAALAAVFYL